jgi:endo-1,4-beta-xylanase
MTMPGKDPNTCCSWGKTPFLLALGLALGLNRYGSVAAEAVEGPAVTPAGVSAPALASEQPFVPQAVVAGGIVVPLYPPGSAILKQERVREAEQLTMTRGVPGRIQSLVNVHNPSIEVHTVEPGQNTGAAVILAPGGGHNTLVVGTEGADFVPFFYNYGVNTVILRYRLRHDGYNPQVDAVNDAFQAIRLVRARATEWGIDPNKIGIIGFSAGAELAAPAALAFDAFEQEHTDAGDPLAGVSSRPDFVGLLYPGPTPFARAPNTPIPPRAPPTFIASAGSSDRVHAIWADQYFAALLEAGVPNLEMHIYGRGAHGNGLKDRDGTPLGKWQARFIDWFRDLGFLQKPGVETRAAQDVQAFGSQPPRSGGRPSAAPAARQPGVEPGGTNAANARGGQP